MNSSGDHPRSIRLADVFQAEADAAGREHTGHAEQRLTECLGILRQNPADAVTRAEAAAWLRKRNRHEEALSLLRKGLDLHIYNQSSPYLLHRYISLLAECNRTEEAIAAAREGTLVFPHDILLKLREALLLPVLYDSPAELGHYRSRFAEGLARVDKDISLELPQAVEPAIAGLAGHTNLYLAYQGKNDRDLQMQYGSLAHRIMSAGYPQWTAPLAMPPAPRSQPLRIGYVSARFRDLSATRFFLGWIRGHDRARVRPHTWQVRPGSDQVTEEVRRFSETFHHFSAAGDLMPVEAIAASIRAANLHALVYLDIGMDPLMTQLAALRLAPIQCMAWDHPVTSGLPSIDYAFSGALSEPGLPEAASHYSEQLALLPGAGVSYRKPLIPFPLLLKTRRDFQLREDAVVYLCCQSAFKFLPQNDHVYTEIAARVPAAQFAFIVANEPVGRDFKSRLDRAFRAAGLRAADHCVFLPQLNHLDYWNLNRVGDVFLDTIEWSSAGSVYEAIACGIPVVALPGRLMRSRQAFAILTQLGVTDTIAGDKATFVDVAVRLATDRGFRLDVVAGMRRGEASLFSDSRSVTALEDFFATLTAPR